MKITLCDTQGIDHLCNGKAADFSIHSWYADSGSAIPQRISQRTDCMTNEAWTETITIYVFAATGYITWPLVPSRLSLRFVFKKLYLRYKQNTVSWRKCSGGFQIFFTTFYFEVDFDLFFSFFFFFFFSALGFLEPKRNFTHQTVWFNLPLNSLTHATHPLLRRKKLPEKRSEK